MFNFMEKYDNMRYYVRNKFNKKWESVDEAIYRLSRTNNCRECISNQLFECWLDIYASHSGDYTYTGRENKEYLIFSIIHILNELKPIPANRMQDYYSNINVFLQEVIDITREEKSWELDKHLALSLCSVIVEDYIFEKIKTELEDKTNTGEDKECIFVNANKADSALKQIILSYTDDVYENMYDPVWLWYYDDIMLLHNEDEDLLYEIYDMDSLEKKVKKRELLPDFYDKM